ncbi:Uncharacterised protein [uncultured archaeon]|nr:Uncharacterised protein [uncultured archaeon]
MKHKYIIGNDPYRAELIMKKLGFETSKLQYLGDYIPEEGETPVVVSGDGHFHGDTHILSRKLLESGTKIDVKIIFDRHLDFYGHIGQSDLIFLNRKKYVISRQDLQNNACLMESSDEFARHALKTYLLGCLSEMYVLGVEGKRGYLSVIEQELRQHIDNGTLPGTEIICTPSIETAKRVRGKKIQISADIDVIPNISCLGDNSWSNSSGPSLEELSEAILKLTENNELVAFDIVGWHLFMSRAKASANKQGLGIYRKLLEQLN